MFNGEDASSGGRLSDPAKIAPLDPGELKRRVEALERRNAWRCGMRRRTERPVHSAGRGSWPSEKKEKQMDLLDEQSR